MAPNQIHAAAAEFHVLRRWSEWWNLSVVEQHARSAVTVVRCPRTQVIDLVGLPAVVVAARKYSFRLKEQVDPGTWHNLDRDLKVRSTWRTLVIQSSFQRSGMHSCGEQAATSILPVCKPAHEVESRYLLRRNHGTSERYAARRIPLSNEI